MRFISINYLRRQQGDRMILQSLQNIPNEFIITYRPEKYMFFSHKWITPQHPDPEGLHVKYMLQELLNANIGYFWYDYCCLPQRIGNNHRSPEEQAEFKIGLSVINEIISKSVFKVIDDEGIEFRAWIVAEVYLSTICQYIPKVENKFLEVVEDLKGCGVNQVVEYCELNHIECTNEDDLLYLSTIIDAMNELCRWRFNSLIKLVMFLSVLIAVILNICMLMTMYFSCLVCGICCIKQYTMFYCKRLSNVYYDSCRTMNILLGEINYVQSIINERINRVQINY